MPKLCILIPHGFAWFLEVFQKNIFAEAVEIVSYSDGETFS